MNEACTARVSWCRWGSVNYPELGLPIAVYRCICVPLSLLVCELDAALLSLLVRCVCAAVCLPFLHPVAPVQFSDLLPTLLLGCSHVWLLARCFLTFNCIISGT